MSDIKYEMDEYGNVKAVSGSGSGGSAEDHIAALKQQLNSIPAKNGGSPSSGGSSGVNTVVIILIILGVIGGIIAAVHYNDPKTQFSRAEKYRNNLNYAEAVRNYELAYDNGYPFDGEDCYAVGKLWYYRLKNKSKGKEWFNRAVNKGIRRAVYADKEVGDRFEFGRYPQSLNGEAEPITWRVLSNNDCFEGYGLLVISERCLDALPYHDRSESVSWSECSMRRWLNDYFLKKAFNDTERSLIKTSELDNNADPTTKDRVFLLSTDEAKRLFADNNDRKAMPSSLLSLSGRDGSPRYWLLRSRGRFAHSVACVDIFGNILNYGLDVNCVGNFYDENANYIDIGCVCVRPAFRIDL